MSDDLLVPSSRELLGAVRRRWWVTLIVAIVTFAAAAAYLGRTETTYTATARIQLGTIGDGTSERDNSFGDTELERLRRDDVLAEAAERLGRRPEVTVAQVGQGAIFSVTASGKGSDVVESANTYAKAFVELRRAELTRLYNQRAQATEARISQLEQARASVGDPAQLGRLDRRLEALGEELDEIVLSEAQVADTVAIFQPAEGASRSSERSSFLLAAALLLALLAGGLAPFAYELLRGRINTGTDILRLVPGLRVLATMPAAGPAVASSSAALPLRLAIETGATGTSSVVAVAPIDPDSAVGELVLETARQLATDSSTVVVEATAEPGLPALLPVGDDPTLLELLSGARTMADDSSSGPSGDDLAVLRLGPGDAALLLRPGLRDVLTDLAKQYSYVLVLAPSVVTPAGLAVASAAGRVVLTAKAGSTRVADLREASAQLETVAVTVLGVVLEGVGRSAGRTR